MDDIEWVDPPPFDDRRENSGRVQRLVAALRANPGQWAKDPKPGVRSLADGRMRDYPGTEWTARRREDGKFDLYGRWVGEQ